MGITDKVKKDIIKALGSGLLVFSIIYLFKKFYDYDTATFVLFQISIIFCIIVSFVGYSRFRIIIYSVFIIVEGYIFHLLERDEILVVYRSDDVFRMIKEVYQGDNYEMDKHEIILLGAVIFILSMLVRACLQFFISRVITLVGISTVLVILGIYNYSVPKTVLFIFILFILCSLTEVCTWIKSKNIPSDQKGILNIYLIPLCVIMALVTVNIPSKEEPLKFEIVRDISNSISDRWGIIIDYYDDLVGNSGVFGVNFTGYSEDGGRLGGRLVEDDTLAMEIKPSKLPKSAIFLTGSIKNVYTGESWETGELPIYEGYNEYFLDYMELFGAVSRDVGKYLSLQSEEKRDDTTILEGILSGKYRDGIINIMDIEVVYKDIKTRSLFYPLKLINILNKGEDTYEYNAQNAGILFNKLKKANTTYINNFCEMDSVITGKLSINNDSFEYTEYFSNLVNLPLHDIYGNFLSRGVQEEISNIYLGEKQFFECLTEPEFYEILNERAKDIQKNYTLLPVDLPRRVYDLAESLTKNYDLKYDKAKAIEEYFKDMTYTLTPEIVPKDRDFVDYFLFEGKEGYCTYYATAMAVLGRCVGLPTRYVEGFVVKSKERVEGYYQVRNRDAHAWVEVYFEGVGWVPFEPTPDIGEIRYAYNWGWGTENQVDSNNSAYEDNLAVSTEPTMPQGAEGNSGNTGTVVDNINALAEVKPIFKVLAALAFVMIIGEGLIIWRQSENYKRLLNYSQKTNKDKVKIIYKNIIKYYKQGGFIKNPNETILDFSNKIYRDHTFEEIELREVTGIFMKARYSKSGITDEELIRADTFAKRLKEKVYKKSTKAE